MYEDEINKLKVKVQGGLHKFLDELISEQKADSAIFRAEAKFSPESCIQWLSCQNFPEKFYWKNRQGDYTIAAAGAAASFGGDMRIMTPETYQAISELLDTKNVKAFGGLKFDFSSLPDKYWTEFCLHRFIIPKFSFECREENILAYNLLVHADDKEETLYKTIANDFALLNPCLAEINAELGAIKSRNDFPDKNAWADKVNKALDIFEKGD
jgi:isochorismate synthase EntC